jgi:hypothetical protein
VNPFIIDGYLDFRSSVNRHFINGQKAYEYFNPQIIREEILNINSILNFDLNKNILEQANDLLSNEYHPNYNQVYEIINKYSIRLAKILAIFHKPSQAQIDERNDWTNAEWEYMRSLKKVYIAGGLVSRNFADIFEKSIKEYFLVNKISMAVEMVKDSSNLAINSLSKVCKRDSLIFDFGQTNVKCGLFINSELRILPSISVEISKGKNLSEYGANCNEFISSVLNNSIKKYPEIKDIKIAISNYVRRGKIDPAPWHYGCLYYFKEDYQKYLSNILDKNIKLYHDTSAMRYYFKREEKAIVLSLGTAFGITFLDTILED